MEKRQSEDTIRMCGLCNIKEKVTEARMRYSRHEKRRDDDEPVKQAQVLEDKE